MTYSWLRSAPRPMGKFRVRLSRLRRLQSATPSPSLGTSRGRADKRPSHTGPTHRAGPGANPKQSMRYADPIRHATSFRQGMRVSSRNSPVLCTTE